MSRSAGSMVRPSWKRSTTRGSTYEAFATVAVFPRYVLTSFIARVTARLRAFGDEIVGVELPAAVELTITETEPGLQGDRVSGGRKPATLETGLVVQVPLFVNQGDRIKVDTRSGDYLGRVND